MGDLSDDAFEEEEEKEVTKKKTTTKKRSITGSKRTKECPGCNSK